MHAAVTSASIDGYAVTNPVGFQGRHVKIGIFNAFAPLVHLGALESVAAELDLELLEIVAEPYAVARVSARAGPAGGRALRRHRRRHDRRRARPLRRHRGDPDVRAAGRAFTKSLADRLDLPFPRAEALKVDYARGLASRSARRSPGSSPTTWPSGRRAWSSSSTSWPAATCCPRGSTCAEAARACRRPRQRCARRGSGSGCRSAGHPRSR